MPKQRTTKSKKIEEKELPIPRNYAEAYLECKDPGRGHLWVEDEETPRASRKPGCYVVVQACARCTGVKIRYFNSKHEQVGSTDYRMPQNYSLGFKPSPREIRRALYNSKRASSRLDQDRATPRGMRPRYPQGEAVIDLTERFQEIMF